jgi:hypothetical protein
MSFSTSRKLSGKRKYNHTQCAITSTGYRCPLYDGDADDTSEPLPDTINSKIIPGRSANVTTPIDDLLARAALLKNPRIPADTVPYLDVYPDLPLPPSNDAAVLVDEVPADNTTAHHLRSLCGVVVTHASAPQITSFITEQLPAPEGAWILGCLLPAACCTSPVPRRDATGQSPLRFAP